jgi:hypothetical protein
MRRLPADDLPFTACGAGFCGRHCNGRHQVVFTPAATGVCTCGSYWSVIPPAPCPVHNPYTDGTPWPTWHDRQNQ